jgi:hypothetical protein
MKIIAYSRLKACVKSSIGDIIAFMCWNTMDTNLWYLVKDNMGFFAIDVAWYAIINSVTDYVILEK